MSSEGYEEKGYGHDLDTLFSDCTNCVFHIQIEVEAELIKSARWEPAYLVAWRSNNDCNVLIAFAYIDWAYVFCN
jgi:hypothetical protein